MKDIEETLKSINFARMSRIKNKMLADFLAQRRRERIYRSKDLDLDDLDMVVAAKGETHNLNETNQS